VDFRLTWVLGFGYWDLWFVVCEFFFGTKNMKKKYFSSSTFDLQKTKIMKKNLQGKSFFFISDFGY